nr:hypothetical protein [Tanacetum cinerariifolium]
MAKKLTSLNFTNWYRSIRIVLKYEKKMKFMEQPIGPAPDPETAGRDTIDKYYEFVNLKQEVACLMLSRFDLNSQSIPCLQIGGSARIPQVANRYGYYADIEEYELGDLNEPPDYKAALADLESDKWINAMDIKIQSMKDNQVWYLVDHPSNGQTVR